MKRLLGGVFMMVLLGGVALYSSYRADLEPSGKTVQHTAGITKEAIIMPDVDYLSQHEMSPFVSSLPVLMVDSNEQVIEKETAVWAKIGILDNNESENNMLDAPKAVINATIKLRGASSYSGFDKSQYRIKFFERKDGRELDYGLAGMGAHSEWVLHGPFLDKSLIRNALVYDLAGEMMDWAPDHRYIELFVNGEYQGVYLAVEPITNGDSRLGLSTIGLASGQTAYVVKRDRVGTEETAFQSWGTVNGKTVNELSIQYPSAKRITPQNKQWIIDDIGKFEKGLYSADFKTTDFNYEDYIDVDNFVDYFILNEVVLNHDAGVLSTYAYKNLDGKLKMSVWDYNNAFDNYQWFAMEYDKYYTLSAPWYDQLGKDREFVDKIIARYEELRQDVLSEDAIFKKIDEKRKYIGEAGARNFKIWGYTFNMKLLNNNEETGEDRNAYNYDQAVQRVKDSVKKRLAYMDASLEEDLYRNLP